MAIKSGSTVSDDFCTECIVTFDVYLEVVGARCGGSHQVKGKVRTVEVLITSDEYASTLIPLLK